MKVSVVIPTYNRLAVLERTLPTILEQEFSAEDYEVIVVVDGSTDGTAEFLKALRPACTLRHLEQPNRGLAAARNAGLRCARGDLVLFLDDDMLCDKALVAEYVAAHRSEDSLLVFGPVLVASGSPLTVAAEWEKVSRKQWVARLSREITPTWPQDIFVGNNTCAPRSLFLASGGFDERFPAFEEYDFGFRLWKIGVQFRYQPTALTYHLYLKSAEDVVHRDASKYGGGEVLLCRKHPEYRPHSDLTQLMRARLLERVGLEACARMAFSPEPLLRPLSRLAGRLRKFSVFRCAESRLLSYRFNIVRVRSAMREVGSAEDFRREFSRRLPVLMFHHVGPPRDGTNPELTVTPQEFERQVHWLARHGYAAIRPSDWLAWLSEGKQLTDKPVLLTFDDGYADTAEYALPLLRRYGFAGVVFIVTGRIGATNTWDEAVGLGTHRLMTADQIRHWAAEGIEFGAHSRTHPDLTKLSPADLDKEVTGSSADLAEILEKRPLSFAYPYGCYNEAARERVSAAFALAFSTDLGVNTLATDPYVLRRSGVMPGDLLLDLIFRLRLGWSPLAETRAIARWSRLRAGLVRLVSERRPSRPSNSTTT